jgi:hypothetical protein
MASCCGCGNSKWFVHADVCAYAYMYEDTRTHLSAYFKKWRPGHPDADCITNNPNPSPLKFQPHHVYWEYQGTLMNPSRFANDLRMRQLPGSADHALILMSLQSHAIWCTHALAARGGSGRGTAPDVCRQLMRECSRNYTEMVPPPPPGGVGCYFQSPPPPPPPPWKT